jgi:uncharacterized protein (TIGR00106 family)
MHKVIAQVTVVPLGTGSTSLSSFVADVQKILDHYPGLKSQLTPMATIIEGDIEEIFRAVREMHEAPFGSGAQRVSTQLSIDDRRDKTASMDTKVASVRDKL